MPISVFCEQCGKEYRIQDSQAGMRVRCPNGHVLTVPAADAGVANDPVPFAVAPVEAGPAPFAGQSPYANPGYAPPGQGGYAVYPFPKGKVMAPAIALIVVASLGFAVSLYNVAFALVAEAPPVDPAAPEFLRNIQQNAVGPLPATLHAIFAGVNAFIIVGAIQMLRFKSWGMGLASTIAAMVNFGTCCCILGLPVGIWSLVILLQPDVKAAFMQSSGNR